MIRRTNRHLQAILNFLLQSSCPLCQRQTAEEVCQYCARQMQLQKLHNQDLWQGQLPVFAWGKYGGTLKRAVAALKYENQPQLAQPLGDWLAKSWLDWQPSVKKLIVVPIPLHIDKQKQRGYNQAALLAESFCRTTGLYLEPMGLKRIRATQAQFSVSAKEREQNLAMAFDLGAIRRHPDTSVLLVDDVYTTGATARAAAQILVQNGIKVHGLVAIATPQQFNHNFD